MKQEKLKPMELVSPDQFELITQDKLYDKFIEVINDELERLSKENNEIYDTADAHISVELLEEGLEDFGEDIMKKAMPVDLLQEIIQAYQEVGWPYIDYEYHPETDDEYATHEFKFYFKNQSIPGINV
jgi:phosphoenolpyruvate synthase/pyruvate phosphate dikinase